MKTVLIGLPESGKSTALAALWYSLNDKSESCEWYLDVNDRPKETSVWNDLRGQWLSGEAIKRTSHQVSPDVLKIKLTHRYDSEEKVSIVTPDIAGEDYEQLYETSRFSEKQAKYLKQSDNLVLFIHPQSISIPVRHKPESESEGSDSSGQDWSPSCMHDFSKIIAMLKAINSIRNDPFNRLTVVVTAWDAIESGGYAPEEYVKNNLSLLHQYVETNYQSFYYGISAQGFDYKNQDEHDYEYDEITRIKIVDQDNSICNDITKIFTPVINNVG